jgi:LysR family transcriptional regulator for bpeEF and oprC
VPALSRWVEQFPTLCVDVVFNDRRTADLPEEGMDVAIRFGMTGDSRVIARKLTDIHFVMCASPAYLRRHGTPLTPQDLKKHNCLAYVLPQTGRYLKWNFTNGKQTWSELISGTINVNDARTLVNYAIEGVGIARVASYMAHEEIRSRRLKMVLSEYIPVGPPIQIVYFQRSYLSARVRAFVDFMVELVPPEPWWDRDLFDFARKKGRSGRTRTGLPSVPT